MTETKPRNSTYTSNQIDKYLARISFPTQDLPKIKPADAQNEVGMAYLTQLQIYQLVNVPFENLALHYSDPVGISLNKDHLFDKIVKRRRGGYCMELNYLFATVLRTLGYEVISTGARVYSPEGQLGGWGHQLNLVCIAGIVFAVDVGFGGACMTRPLALAEGLIEKWGATRAEMRLRYKASASSFCQGLWQYEHRNSNTEEWKPIYCFGMTEFTKKDFEIMNYATSTSRTSWFTSQVICQRMILDKSVDDITGAIFILDKVLKKRVQGRSETLATFSNEIERLQKLVEFFGLELSKLEQAGIAGTVSEIK